MTPLPLIFDLSLDELNSTLLTWGEPAYRASQIWKGIYDQLVSDPHELTVLPKSLRERLADTFNFRALDRIAISQSNDDNTEKVLFRLNDGEKIETVFMRYNARRTLCISTQVGCAMGCVFCATGQMGLQRSLTAGEIVEQVLSYARDLAKLEDRLTNIVMMGMGEPFHNYQATIAAIKRLGDPDGFNFGARRFTISTIGLVPMIDRFTQEALQVNLAISLHAATNELRDQLLPINQHYPLSTLLPACANYVEATGRRISFEWALIEGLNDGLDQANELIHLVKGLKCHVNLILLNPTQSYDGKASSLEQAKQFRDLLTSYALPCTIRSRRGVEINAGCGQLATDHDLERD
jgi:23S rRNA (adenine2503-C2)-methyltransferase